MRVIKVICDFIVSCSRSNAIVLQGNMGEQLY